MDDQFNPLFRDDDNSTEELVRKFINDSGISNGKSEEEIEELVEAIVNPEVSMDELSEIIGLELGLDFDSMFENDLNEEVLGLDMSNPEEVVNHILSAFDFDEEDINYEDIIEGMEGMQLNSLPMMENLSDPFLENFKFSEEADMLTMIDEMDEFITHYTDEWKSNQLTPWLQKNMMFFLYSKFELAQIYFENGLYREALKHFEQVNEHSPDLYPHIRYYIMAIYVIFNDMEHAAHFFSSNKEHADDDMMLLLYLILAIISRQEKLSEMLFERLLEVNEKVAWFASKSFFRKLGDTLKAYAEDSFEDVESRPKVDTIYKGLSYLVPYIFQIDSYLYNNFMLLARKKINPRFIGNYDGIRGSVRSVLNKFDIYTYEDLEHYTEEEIRSIRGVGEVAINYLKEAGAKFKS